MRINLIQVYCKISAERSIGRLKIHKSCMVCIVHNTNHQTNALLFVSLIEFSCVLSVM
jgi:hypothetical protein